MADYKKGTPNRFSEMTGNELTIVFDSPEKALAFKSWLCGSGEQGMWDWEDCEDIHFDYWSEGNRIDARSDPKD